jgi:hypothetical protein
MPRRSHTPDVVAALPGDVHHIMKETGLTQQGIRRILLLLRAEGKAHIWKWRRGAGNAIPVWRNGPGEDAPKPKRIPIAKSCRDFRKRVKKAIAAHDAGQKPDPRYLKHISLHIANKTAKTGDPLLWALFGGQPKARS